MAEINDLSVTDASNTGRFPENQAPSTVNNGARALEGMLARGFKDTVDGAITTGGTDTAYTVAANRVLTAYYDGLTLCVEWNATCGETPTVNVDALGAKALYWPDGTQVTTGHLLADSRSFIQYDGTNFLVLSAQRYVPALGTAAVLNVGTSANNVVQLNGSGQLPAVDGSLLTGIDTGNAAQIEANSANILLLAVRLAIQEAATRWGMFKGFVDDFVDQSGVDLTASTGETYDAGTDVYRNGTAGSDETSAGSPSSLGGFSGAIFVDRSWSVDNGKTVSHVAFSSNTAAGDYDVYIFERIASGSYTPRAKIASVSHPGGLAVTYFALGSPYVVPGSGDFYVGVDTKSNATQGTTGSVVRTTRSTGSLDVGTNYNSGWTEATNNTVYVGVRYASITETMTLVSEPETVSPAPTSARAIVLAKTAGGITLPGDLTVSISRDDGVTWTAGTLSLLADYNTDIEAFVTEVTDISGQPSGTDLRLRAVTADDKLIELSTWAVQAV